MSDSQPNPSTIFTPSGGRAAVSGSVQPQKTAVAGDTQPEETAAAGSGAQGSTITQDYGKRTMKAYALTEGELGELFVIGGFATFFFSLAAGFFGFYVNTYENLSLNPSLAKEIIDQWGIISEVCKYSAGISAVIGLALIYFRHTKIAQIKRETEFGVK